MDLKFITYSQFLVVGLRKEGIYLVKNVLLTVYLHIATCS